jgi:hypothetical protein
VGLYILKWQHYINIVQSEDYYSIEENQGDDILALVKKLEKTEINARVHGEVVADYNIVIKDGKKYLQINTYGSEHRKENKVSQTIQFNEESVKQLIGIINKEFGM